MKRETIEKANDLIGEIKRLEAHKKEVERRASDPERVETRGVVQYYDNFNCPVAMVFHDAGDILETELLKTERKIKNLEKELAALKDE